MASAYRNSIADGAGADLQGIQIVEGVAVVSKGYELRRETEESAITTAQPLLSAQLSPHAALTTLQAGVDQDVHVANIVTIPSSFICVPTQTHPNTAKRAVRRPPSRGGPVLTAEAGVTATLDDYGDITPTVRPVASRAQQGKYPLYQYSKRTPDATRAGNSKMMLKKIESLAS